MGTSSNGYIRVSVVLVYASNCHLTRWSIGFPSAPWLDSSPGAPHELGPSRRATNGTMTLTTPGAPGRHTSQTSRRATSRSHRVALVMAFPPRQRRRLRWSRSLIRTAICWRLNAAVIIVTAPHWRRVGGAVHEHDTSHHHQHNQILMMMMMMMMMMMLHGKKHLGHPQGPQGSPSRV